MTKKDLIAAVCNATPHLPYKVIEDGVTLLFDMITFYLTHHQRVELRGFGIFCVRKRAAHKAHNPQTGETLMVPEKVVPFFKPSQHLKVLLKETISTSPIKTNFFTALYRDLRGRP